MAYVTDSFDDEIVQLLQEGKVGVLPTDTIYGLSCRAEDPEAAARLHKLKKRDSNKPFIILISKLKMLDLLSIKNINRELPGKYWPDALSILFPAADSHDWLHLGTKTLAIRYPEYPELSGLIDKTGPIISTSANLQGEKPVSNIKEAQQLFGDELDFYVDVGPLNNPPSTLVQLREGKFEIVRQGAVKISKEDLL